MAKPQTTVYNNFVGSDDIIDDLSDPQQVIGAGRKPESKHQSPQKAAPSANVNVTASLT